MSTNKTEQEKRRSITWRLKVACLILVALLAGAPIVPLVALGPQQTVRTIDPKMGIHTRLTDEVEPWKIKRTLELVRGMGTTWIAEYFPWAYYDTSPGSFDWTHADLVVDHARRQGLTVIARLGFVPEWARPDPEVEQTTFTYLDDNGNPATLSTDIRVIRVDLVVTVGNQTVTLRSSEHIRNLL